MDTRNLPKRDTPYWSKYQREIFERGTKDHILPPFSSDPVKLRELAQKRLSAGGWSYLNANASNSLTHEANLQAFYKWKVILK
jgi:hypothetical protein